MAKRARDSKTRAAKQAQPAPAPPAIMRLNPTSFIDGETYHVGVSLQNFNSVRAAFFSESSPLAAFSNINAFTPFPPSGPPQQILFLNSKFSYTGSVASSAYLTVTVISGTGATVSKTFDVNFNPKGSVAPSTARMKARGVS